MDVQSCRNKILIFLYYSIVHLCCYILNLFVFTFTKSRNKLLISNSRIINCLCPKMYSNFLEYKLGLNCIINERAICKNAQFVVRDDRQRAMETDSLEIKQLMIKSEPLSLINSNLNFHQL